MIAKTENEEEIFLKPYLVLGFKSNRHCKGNIPIFNWWRKTSGARPCSISGASWDLRKAINIQYTS